MALVVRSGPLLTLFIALAAGVYVTKVRVRLIYAAREIYVGIFALSFAAQKALATNSYNPEERTLFFISLMTGVFLVARGVDDARPYFERIFKR